MNKTDKAIKAFEHLKEIINDDKIPKDNIWVNHLGDLVAKYIGKETNNYEYVLRRKSQSHFFRFHLPDQRDIENNYEKDSETAKRFIDSCQNYIKNNGLYKSENHKNNFLGQFDNRSLLTIIITSATALITLGTLIGTYQNKRTESNTITISTILETADSTKKITGTENTNKQIKTDENVNK
jgi:hypothetical protein